MADENKIIKDTTQQVATQTPQATTAQTAQTQQAVNTQKTIVPVNNNASQLNAAYQRSLGRAPDVEGQNYWLGQVENGNLTMDQVAAQIASSPEAQQYKQNNTPQFNYDGKPVTSLGTATPATPTMNYTGTPVTAGQYVAPTYNPTGMLAPGAVEAYNNQREQGVRDLYQMAQENSLAALKTAYDQNLANAEYAKGLISPQYQSAMNQQAATNETQRRNLNMQAAANGLNTGAGSQMQLAQSIAGQQAQGSLRKAEQEALNQAQQNILNLQTTYQNQVAEAIANNNYQLAAALLSEYENAYNRQMEVENLNYQRAMAEDERAYGRFRDTVSDQRYAEETSYNRALNDLENQWRNAQWLYNLDRDRLADERYGEETAYGRTLDDYNRQMQNMEWNENQRRYNLENAINAENTAYNRNIYNSELARADAEQKAQYGDFSGYAELYGPDAAAQMATLWSYQNPLLAYNLGYIDANRYFQLTGQMPYGMEAVEEGGGGYDGGYYGGGGSSNDNGLFAKYQSMGISPTAVSVVGNESNPDLQSHYGNGLTRGEVKRMQEMGLSDDDIRDVAKNAGLDQNLVNKAINNANASGSSQVSAPSKPATPSTAAPAAEPSTGNNGFWKNTWGLMQQNLSNIFI